MRRFLLAAALVLASVQLPAQNVRNISQAGRQHIKPIPPKPSTFSPAAFDASAPLFRAGNDADFVNYLLDKGLVTDALVLLGEKNYVPSDTLSWLRGLALFDDRQFEAADTWLKAVNGPLSEPALFFDIVAKTQLDSIAAAKIALSAYTGQYMELAALQRGGLALIEGDAAAYASEASHFTYADYRLTDRESALDDLARSLSRKRSPFLAAAMSAVLPGAGKIYAGQTGPGVSSLLTVGALGAITAEQWKHYGFKDWRTILSGSLFAIFYIGNIYGSYVSVGIQEQVLRDERKALVVYNIHIPLREYFR